MAGMAAAGALGLCVLGAASTAWRASPRAPLWAARPWALGRCWSWLQVIDVLFC